MTFCPKCEMYMKPMGGCCEFCGYDLTKHYKELKKKQSLKKKTK